ncbi:MAG: caspase family protein [Candidatus Obscuribacterales bacterium]|nr:caspase family protein [Candidatus Obscuribacterales bacterium]
MTKINKGSLVAGAIACGIAISVSLLPSSAVGEQQRLNSAKVGAKNLFYRQIEFPSEKKNIGLTYSIELIRDGKVASVDSRFPFRSGDQLRFHVQSNADGYLYIAMKQGSKGDSAVLFPPGGAAENNEVKAGQDIVVPAKGVLEFDNTPGNEIVKLVLSTKKLEGAELNKYSRSVLITPKQKNQSISAEYLLEFASAGSDASTAQFSSPDKPPAFAAEPALTVVSETPDKPLSVELLLSHASASGATAALPEGVPDFNARETGSASTNIASANSRPNQHKSPKANASNNAIVTDKWALVIGISDFKDPKWNLMYPAKDAQDFANFLVKEGHFAPDHVKVLINSNATRQNILSAFGEGWLPENVKPGDIALVYVATHGTSSSQDAKKLNYLVAYDTDPKHAFSTGINIQDLVATIKQRLNEDANRLVLVLDTCHSGSAEPGAKALAAPMFDISDLIQGTGQMIIASAGSLQTAHDSMRYQNGIFTKHFIDGLRKYKKLSDAFSYTKAKVAEESKADFHNEQTPMIKDAEWSGSEIVLTVPPAQPRTPSKK